jgi:23S rRNA pseudouridine1911/1915/1917 synthase
MSHPPQTLHIEVTLPNEGKRLDTFVAAEVKASRSSVQKWIEKGIVFVDGHAYPASYKLKQGQKIRVDVPPPEPLLVEAEDIPLDILYEDEDVVVVNKPRGMVVHPAAGNRNGTLVNALLNHCDDLSGINGVLRPGIVHRIDKDTTGSLIVAKNDRAHAHLSNQLQAHTLQRVYWALVDGNVKEDTGEIDAPIARHRLHRKKMAVVPTGEGRDAQTRFRVLERFNGPFGVYTLVELQLLTGRTHQIRVHMAYAGHPVTGDPVYGAKRCRLPLAAQALHARTLGFVHPKTEEQIVTQAPLHEDFKKALVLLGSTYQEP